ncbi:MAG TPA: RNA methyltransferase [Actinomycetes bacterium]|nr:RNA methyltransferase [Actinomycetes bacterium]
MIVRSVTDPSDPLLDDYRNLTDVGLRRRLEPEHGLFMAESHQVIARALAVGYPVRSVLTTPRWLSAVEQLDLPVDCPVFVGDEDLVRAVTGYRVHRGALAAMSRLPLPSIQDVVDAVRADRSRIAIFENIVDHTNLGAGIRSAAALGVDGVLVTPECADPLYRRSVRVSMGAVFAVPWTRLRSWPDDIKLLKASGYTVAAMTPGEQSIDLDDFVAAAHPHFALILGTEGAGITPAAQELADYRLRIPMAGGVDSLNVAAAAAVAFYTTR